MLKITLSPAEAAADPRIDELLSTPAPLPDEGDWRHIDPFSFPDSKFPDRSLLTIEAAPLSDFRSPDHAPSDRSPGLPLDPFEVVTNIQAKSSE